MLYVPRLVCLLALAIFPLLAAEPKPFPDLAVSVGEELVRDYYDQARFQPRLMVERALRRLAQHETSIRARWESGLITLNLGTEVIEIAAAEPADLHQAMAILDRVRLTIENGKAFKPERARELSYAMVNGALAVLDPHTEISAPDLAKLFREDMAGEFYGIGAFLRSEENILTVERVIPGTPAERAGIEDGDMILAINGEKTAGLLQEQAVRRIRGPKGSTVTLTIERKGGSQANGTSTPAVLDVPVLRDLVQAITLRSWRSGDVAYIRLDEFHQRANQALCQEYIELSRGGPFKVLVLDMRFNGGGLLDQAKAICANFLSDEREIVRTVTVDNKPMIYKSRRRAAIDVPVVVLTSPGTASAAEIVAGALQRNDRAVVAGRVTFGKGTVQTLRDMDDESRLRLTIQEYQLPGGVSIQDIGVMPDLALVQHSLRLDERLDLKPPTYMREGDNEFAIINRRAYRHQSTYELGWLARQPTKDVMKKESIASRNFVPDQEARMMIELLQKVTALADFSPGAAQAVKEHKLRPWLLERLKEPVAERAQSEAAALAAALAQLAKPVVWGAGEPAAPDTVTVTYTGPAELEAGAKSELTFAVANRGNGDIGRLFGVIRADKASPLWEDEVVVGKVEAAQTVSAVLPFAVPPRAFSGEERFTLDLFQEGRKEPVTSLPVKLAIRAQPRPHLGFSWRIEEADATRDNKLEPDEQGATLVVTLFNDGGADTAELDVRVFKDNDPFVELGKPEFKRDPLPKDGGKEDLRVPILVKKQSGSEGRTVTFSGNTVKVQLVVQERFGDKVDGRYRVGLVHAIAVSVGAPLNPRTIRTPRFQLEDVVREGGNRVSLSVRIEDENLRYMGCFIDEDKVDLKSAKDLGLKAVEGKVGVEAGTYRTTLTLKPGINNVQIYAVDQDDAEQFLPLRLWGEGEPLAQKKKAGSPVEVP